MNKLGFKLQSLQFISIRFFFFFWEYFEIKPHYNIVSLVYIY